MSISQSQARRVRRGMTIIELILVMSTLILVLGLCTGLIHAVLRLDRTGRSYVVETTTIGRLSRQFRGDVHAATRVRPSGGVGDLAPGLELVLPGDRTVRYQSRDRSLVRTQQHGEVLERREIYTLPFCPAPQFAVETPPGQTWASLRLPRSTQPGTNPGPDRLYHELTIEAAVGRDQRFAAPDEKEKEATP
jgi:hypothetical protein